MKRKRSWAIEARQSGKNQWWLKYIDINLNSTSTKANESWTDAKLSGYWRKYFQGVNSPSCFKETFFYKQNYLNRFQHFNKTTLRFAVSRFRSIFFFMILRYLYANLVKCFPGNENNPTRLAVNKKCLERIDLETHVWNFNRQNFSKSLPLAEN